MTFKTKLNLLIILPLFSVVVVLGGLFVSSERLHLEREIEKRHRELTLELARVCAQSLHGDDLELFELFRSFEFETGFLNAAMTDDKNIVRIGSDLARIGSAMPALPAVPTHSDVARVMSVSEDRPVVEYATPIYDAGINQGMAHMTFDQTVLQHELHSQLRKLIQRILSIGLVALLLGLVAAWIFARRLIAPIDHVIKGMNRLSAGELQPIAELGRHDELGNLVSEFNATVLKLKEVEKLKEEFTASVTHELRSPLTAIERFVALLLKGVYGRLSAEQHESLLIISNNTIRLNAMIDNILTVAKLESKQNDLFYEDVDVREVVRDVIKLFSSFSTGGPVRLDPQMPAEPVIARIDRNKLVHVLSNLVSNAFKFTVDGNILIQLVDAADSIEIAVKDTGIGVADTDKQQIFTKFFRVASSAHTTKGTGLGLAIVKTYVELMKGEITVTNNLPHGSIFVVRLPKLNKDETT